ncbi:F-box/LRR-repeat protein 12-like [Asterias amurensis]|uniref:F-box/LRR-repeat protein 12-like n=1 Tax=Asterias amurensis TaxID=7602 RepID=UPI003AB47390
MDSIPVSVMVRIFSFLEVKEKCKAARVCKAWYHLMREKELWKFVDLSSFRVNLQSTWKIIRCYFTDALKTLHLRGFMNSIKNTECISNAVLKDLFERCPNITELHIEDAMLANIDSGNLPPTLKILKLKRCQTTFGWFKSAVDKGRFDHLHTLNVERSTRFCNEDLKDLASIPGGGKLERLSFSSCYRVKHEGFVTMSEHLTHLTHLDICRTNVTDDDMHFICRQLKQLESLLVQDCDSLTDFSVGSLSTLPNLQELDLGGSSMKFTGDCIISLMGRLHKLKRLYISLSETITEADLEQIQSRKCNCNIIIQ